MEEDKFTKYKKWTTSNSFDFSNKLEICRIGSQSNYGVRAIDLIPEGSLLFRIPRQCILSPKTTKISQLLAQEASSLESTSGWLPLLVSMAYETTISDSFWTPYLEAVPNFHGLELPMFWSKDELLRLAQGTGIVEQVTTDVEKIEKEFREVYIPFIESHADVFTVPECRSLDFYKRLVAFVMAYSFTEPTDLDYTSDDEEEEDDSDDEGSKKKLNSGRIETGEEQGGPFMVPMADMLNHTTENNAAVVFAESELRVEALRDIAAGEEVTNTYGDLANWQLVSTHGFSLPPEDNHWDTVDIRLAGDTPGVGERAQQRWLRLDAARREAAAGGDGWPACVTPVDADGFMNTEELGQTLHLLTMEDVEFENWLTQVCPNLVSTAAEDSSTSLNNGWEEVSEEVTQWTDLLSTGQTVCLARLPASWRDLLAAVCRHKLSTFPASLPEDEARLAGLSESQPDANRERSVLCVRVGQQRLVDMLLRNLRV